jgi:hypothetical protein
VEEYPKDMIRGNPWTSRGKDDMEMIQIIITLPLLTVWGKIASEI